MRITFLTHPYCYAESLMVKRNWMGREYHEYELGVARRWFAAIDRMTYSLVRLCNRVESPS